MVTHYIDITLLPDAEFSHAHLLAALYAKLHQALALHQANDIGVSFPQHSLRPRTLGTVVRVHGTVAGLARLMRTDWLQGMRDHVKRSNVQPVPENAPHCVVQRRQFKTSVERLRRRRMQRKGESAEQAAAAIPQSVERTPNLPYVQLKSATTKQPFFLFIEIGKVHTTPVIGLFNTYGLSQTTTIPWF